MRILLSVLLLSACSALPPAPAPRPAPVVTPVAPAPSPVSVDQPVTAQWADMAADKGEWVYRHDERGSIALFGETGRDAQFLVRCDTPRRRIFISRAGTVSNPDSAAMTIYTSSGRKAFTVRPTGAAPAYVAVEIDPRETHLDAMAFSRGKFLVALPGRPHLVVPNWAELGRVVEDCRG